MWSNHAGPLLGEKQVVLSGPSVGHFPDTAELKSSISPTDHGTSRLCSRRRVNFVMGASSPPHILVILLSTYWQSSCTVHLEWISTVQWSHAQTDKQRQRSEADKSRPFLFMHRSPKTHPLLITACCWLWSLMIPAGSYKLVSTIISHLFLSSLSSRLLPPRKGKGWSLGQCASCLSTNHKTGFWELLV